MKKRLALMAVVLTTGCASNLVTLQPPGGGAEAVGKMTRGIFGSNQIEISLNGKTYRGEWQAESDHDAASWPHQRHVGKASAELTANDGSKLSCHWVFHGVKGEGTCACPGTREYRMTTQ